MIGMGLVCRVSVLRGPSGYVETPMTGPHTSICRPPSARPRTPRGALLVCMYSTITVSVASSEHFSPDCMNRMSGKPYR